MRIIELMLQNHPRMSESPEVDDYAETIAAIAACAETCVSCADACLAEEEHLGELRRCIRLNGDCSDISQATARVLTRQTETAPEVIHALLSACIIACQTCAAESGGHRHRYEHCAMCADACTRCQEKCQHLLALISVGASLKRSDA